MDFIQLIDTVPSSHSSGSSNGVSSGSACGSSSVAVLGDRRPFAVLCVVCVVETVFEKDPCGADLPDFLEERRVGGEAFAEVADRASVRRKGAPEGRLRFRPAVCDDLVNREERLRRWVPQGLQDVVRDVRRPRGLFVVFGWRCRRTGRRGLSGGPRSRQSPLKESTRSDTVANVLATVP